MCGIAGIASFGEKPVLLEEIQRMCEALYHRGPDEDGFYVTPDVGLGMRRLSIIDLKTGRQPVSSKARSGRIRERMEQRRAAPAKQLRMAQLVARVDQKEPPQHRIGRHFGSPHQIAPAICLGFGEAEQLARAPRRVEPDPPMDWPQQGPHHFHEKIFNIPIAPIQRPRRSAVRPSYIPRSQSVSASKVLNRS